MARRKYYAKQMFAHIVRGKVIFMASDLQLAPHVYQQWFRQPLKTYLYILHVNDMSCESLVGSCRFNSIFFPDPDQSKDLSNTLCDSLVCFWKVGHKPVLIQSDNWFDWLSSIFILYHETVTNYMQSDFHAKLLQMLFLLQPSTSNSALNTGRTLVKKCST